MWGSKLYVSSSSLQDDTGRLSIRRRSLSDWCSNTSGQDDQILWSAGSPKHSLRLQVYSTTTHPNYRLENSRLKLRQSHRFLVSSSFSIPNFWWSFASIHKIRHCFDLQQPDRIQRPIMHLRRALNIESILFNKRWDNQRGNFVWWGNEWVQYVAWELPQTQYFLS